MNRNDDQLISKFMQTNKHEVADNGFTRQVMRRLPTQAKQWSDILTAVCTVLCCIVFYVYDGPVLLLQSLHGILQYEALDLITNNNLNLPTLLPALVVLAWLGIQKACTVKG